MNAAPTKRLGDWGEEVAARHLEQNGWSIIDRNYRYGRNEIDLVASRGEVVSFVEVKTRLGVGHGDPLESIGARKRGSIERVAERWVDAHGREGVAYRFDAVSIQRELHGNQTIVRHVEDAWGL